MRVVVPEPASSNRAAREALEAEGIAYELRAMAGELDYGRLMRELWEAGEEFCICEHDIRPAPGQVAALEGCPDGILCGYDYPGPEGDALGHSLGLSRFSQELLELAPEAWQGWGDNRPLLQWDLTPWIQVDAAIFDALAGYGVSVNPTEDGHRFPHIFHVHGEVEHTRTAPH